MWRMMVTTSMTTKKVFRELLCVLEDWPLHSTSTCDGDQQDVLALAATRALREILRMPRCPRGLKVHFPRLLLALLFQVVYSTEQMSDEVDTFWRECQEEGGLPTSPSRLVAFEMERKRGWDTLLHAETHHSAMGLLAREIHGVSRHFNASVASYLVELLSKKEPRCELPAMAFLVEILASPGADVRAESFLQLVPRYLQSTCSITRSLVLKGLTVICDTPWMVPKLRFLVQRLMDLLQDTDMDTVRMTLSVLIKVIQGPGFRISTPIALQLAQRLQPLLDNESWYVRHLSVSIFKEVIERVPDDGKKPLKTLVHQSLLPLIFHVFDENKAVAATCWGTLLLATPLLKKEKLRQVVLRDQQIEAIGECLLVECRSRAAEYLRQSLTYVQSPQDSIREAAVAFLGVLGQHMRAQPEKVRLIYHNPNWELPEEEQKQEYTHVLHNPRAKVYWESFEPKDREGSTVVVAEAMTKALTYDTEAGAALLDMLVESEVSTLKQVPRIVRCIHRWFMTNMDESVEHRLDNTLVELTDAHPHDVVVALLRCAPSCDRYWETCPEGSGLPSL
ncbi:hypothetical protein Q9233_008828 [Columba guinea]|nr:hypothetical protein Q9233_008826 [Columba guinea]KAK2526194.1 hypothetical protein Q9233_008827 [Columba guinea]KAK2526195.1 hypothetical protein Q9233_008828 [Columba guinea]